MTSCLVCNTNENLTRHHIIPYLFISYAAKKHDHLIANNNIAILCRECHDLYEKDFSKYKANKLEIPFFKVKFEEALSLKSYLEYYKKKNIHELNIYDITGKKIKKIINIIFGEKEILSTKEDLDYINTKIDNYFNYICFRIDCVAIFRNHFLDYLNSKK